MLQVTMRSARNSRTRVANQIRDIIVSAPDELRSSLSDLSTPERAKHCSRFRITADVADPLEATRLSLRILSRRYEALTSEMSELEATIDSLTARANPSLRGIKGVGPDTAAILLAVGGDNPERMKSEATFAALCGVSPIEASSGKTIRHRLNRSGNRQANNALWRIVMVRIACDPETQAYVERRQAEGKSRREITRCDASAMSHVRCISIWFDQEVWQAARSYRPPGRKPVTALRRLRWSLTSRPPRFPVSNEGLFTTTNSQIATKSCSHRA